MDVIEKSVDVPLSDLERKPGDLTKKQVGRSAVFIASSNLGDGTNGQDEQAQLARELYLTRGLPELYDTSSKNTAAWREFYTQKIKEQDVRYIQQIRERFRRDQRQEWKKFKADHLGDEIYRVVLSKEDAMLLPVKIDAEVELIEKSVDIPLIGLPDYDFIRDRMRMLAQYLPPEPLRRYPDVVKIDKTMPPIEKFVDVPLTGLPDYPFVLERLRFLAQYLPPEPVEEVPGRLYIDFKIIPIEKSINIPLNIIGHEELLMEQLRVLDHFIIPQPVTPVPAWFIPAGVWVEEERIYQESYLDENDRRFMRIPNLFFDWIHLGQSEIVIDENGEPVLVFNFPAGELRIVWR